MDSKEDQFSFTHNLLEGIEPRDKMHCEQVILQLKAQKANADELNGLLMQRLVQADAYKNNLNFQLRRKQKQDQQLLAERQKANQLERNMKILKEQLRQVKYECQKAKNKWNECQQQKLQQKQDAKSKLQNLTLKLQNMKSKVNQLQIAIRQKVQENQNIINQLQTERQKTANLQRDINRQNQQFKQGSRQAEQRIEFLNKKLENQKKKIKESQKERASLLIAKQQQIYQLQRIVDISKQRQVSFALRQKSFDQILLRYEEQLETKQRILKDYNIINQLKAERQKTANLQSDLNRQNQQFKQKSQIAEQKIEQLNKKLENQKKKIKESQKERASLLLAKQQQIYQLQRIVNLSKRRQVQSALRYKQLEQRVLIENQLIIEIEEEISQIPSASIKSAKSKFANVS